jgi:serine/threonine protein phosphatase PrpC
MEMQFAFKTDIGQIRSHNEDSGGVFLHESGMVLAIVADGMGGHQAGDVASQMTRELLFDSWSNVDKMDNPTIAEDWLNRTILNVNESLYVHAKEHIKCQGMGTTVVAAICTEQFVTIAHIGDSRCYLFNQHGFHQKTEDHSLVNELVRTGQISVDEAEVHPRKNVLLRALGTESAIKIDVNTMNWEEGDYLLLCSDGLSNKVTSEDMQRILQSDVTIKEKSERLVQTANQMGGEDNISVALVLYNSPKDGNES